MKFYCDSCNTKYKISDDKVKGKILKIRCKNCQHIIVVRETGVEPTANLGNPLLKDGQAPLTAIHQAVPGLIPKAPDTTDWYVAIKGKQVGPMKKDGVLNLYRNNRIHDRSHCWHEGLMNWTRFEDLPDFKQSSVPPPPPVPSDNSPPSFQDDKTEHSLAGPQSFAAQDTSEFVEQPPSAPSLPPAAPTQPPVGAAPPTATPPPVAPPQAMAGAPGVPPAAPDPFAAVQTAPHLKVGAPIGEKTRVFIAQAGLANRKAKHRAYGATAIALTLGIISALWLEWKGIIEIPWLSSKITELTVAVAGEDVAKNRKKREYKAADGGSDIACKLMGNCPEPVVAKKQPVRRRPAKQQKLEDMDLSDAFGSGGPNAAKVGRAGDMATMDIGAVGTGGSLSGLFGTEKKASTVKEKEGVKNRMVAGASSGGLDAAAASKVISQNLRSVQKCAQDEVKKGSGIEGKKVIKVTVRNDGSVRSALFRERALNQGSLGDCVKRATKRWRFPTYSGEETSVEVPLIFTN